MIIKLPLRFSVYHLIKIFHMKKISLTLAVIAFVTTTALAQQKRDFKHHEMAKHQHGMLMKQLNLSTAQKAQFKTDHQEFKQKMQELNKNESMTVKDFRDRKFALRKEQKSKIDGLLTPEQKTKFAQLKTEQKAKKEGHFAGHLNKMKTQLGLTDNQVAQLKSQRDDMHLKMKSIKENESLSREQVRDQVMALKNEAKEQHKKIFTEDQLKKMEELKKTRFEKTPAK